jgi:signal transduction histidine kinase
MSVSIVIGVVHLAVAFALLASVRRSAAMFPWLLALAAFFAVRGLDRIVNAVHDPPPIFGQLADAFVVATLVLLLVGLPRTVTALRAAYDDANRQTQAYARALHDYRRLVRHRLANPLAAVRGGVQTLRDVEGLTAGERRLLLDMLHEQVLRLEHLSLEPHPAAPEEQGFHPAPPHDAAPPTPARLSRQSDVQDLLHLSGIRSGND